MQQYFWWSSCITLPKFTGADFLTSTVKLTTVPVNTTTSPVNFGQHSQLHYHNQVSHHKGSGDWNHSRLISYTGGSNWKRILISYAPRSLLVRGDWKHFTRMQEQGGSDKNSASERSHVNVITIGANWPYWRRKRPDLNRLTSVQCEGIGKIFFCIFLKRMKSFLWYFFFFFAPHFGKIQLLLSEVIFFYVFFLAFLVFIYVFSVII